MSSTTPSEAPRWPPVTETDVHGFGTQFVGELDELLGREVAHVRGYAHAVQQRRGGPAGVLGVNSLGGSLLGE